MRESFVRIESIEIRNFKNVKCGKIKLSNNRKSFNASILGLYGQNGSGKTALIDALSLLKLALSGMPVPESFTNMINVDEENASFEFQFKVVANEPYCEYNAIYSFKLKKVIDERIENISVNNTNYSNNDIPAYKAVIYDEVLSCSYETESEKSIMQTIIKTNCKEVFVPEPKYKLLVGSESDTKLNLIVGKKVAYESSYSFVFSGTLLNTIRKKSTESIYRNLIERLVIFGNFELFVINTTNTALITMDALPLAFSYKEKDHASIGSIGVKLDGVTKIPKDAFDVVKKVILNMNIVLTKLVPGLTIGVKELGQEIDNSGKIVSNIQLTSLKNNKEIPLRCESEGIKKIISVLQLLIVIYNKPSITVAIDEFDSGIFEYLLGELLRIVSEKGKGQLIFTSHNLRPLETIDRGFIAFTTTNPENRYIRLSNVKSNNNLRDFYYRDIILGEQNEVVYDTTDNYEIALAFREAGDVSAS